MVAEEIQFRYKLEQSGKREEFGSACGDSERALVSTMCVVPHVQST